VWPFRGQRGAARFESVRRRPPYILGNMTDQSVQGIQEAPPGGEIRFGVRSEDGRFRSGTFKLWTLPSKDDVYIVSREVGRDLKVSLHEKGVWHLKFEPTGPNAGVGPPSTERWPRPPETAPGMTRAFAVVVPAPAVRVPISEEIAVAPILWFVLEPGVAAVQFTVIFTAPGAKVSSWPGARAMGTTLIGRIRLPCSAEMVWVVAHALDEVPVPRELRNGQPKSLPILDAEARDRLLTAATAGSLKALLFGDDDEGMWWFMDVPIEAR